MLSLVGEQYLVTSTRYPFQPAQRAALTSDAIVLSGSSTTRRDCLGPVQFTTAIDITMFAFHPSYAVTSLMYLGSESSTVQDSYDDDDRHPPCDLRLADMSKPPAIETAVFTIAGRTPTDEPTTLPSRQTLGAPRVLEGWTKRLHGSSDQAVSGNRIPSLQCRQNSENSACVPG